MRSQLDIIQSEHRPSIQRLYERAINPRKCSICNSTDTYIVKRHGVNILSYYQRWFFIGNEILCSRCYSKTKYHTDNVELNRQRMKDKRRVVYNGKRIILPSNPRTGKCSKCGKEGWTRIHTAPNDFSPMLDAVEVCQGCYMKARAIAIKTKEEM